jgi:YcxB-like protein
MPPPLVISADLTRDDYINASRICIELSPLYLQAARQVRRRQARRLVFILPVFVLGGAFLVGSRTERMYLEGAVFGTIVAGLYCMYACRLSNYLDPMKKQALRQVQAADYSDYIGPVTYTIDDERIRMTTPTSEHAVSWAIVEGLFDLGDWFLIQWTARGGIVIPKRAFPDAAAATAFFLAATEQWQAARLPEPDRIARFLKDRDLPCPNCRYNLRGCASTACPECGAPLTLQQLRACAGTP